MNIILLESLTRTTNECLKSLVTIWSPCIFRDEHKKCQEHIDELQKDKELVSNEIEEAETQNNM